MRPLQALTFALLLTLFFSSCATITRGSTDSVIVRTQPSGALVTLSNGMSGTSPASFELPRKNTVVVSISKPGYQPMEVTLNPVLTNEGGTHMAGNILAGGIIGVAVDAGSGAAYDLTPNPLEVTLIPMDEYYDESMDEYNRDYANAIRQGDPNGFGVEDSEAHDMQEDPYTAQLPNGYDPYAGSNRPMDVQEDSGYGSDGPDVSVGPDGIEADGTELPDPMVEPSGPIPGPVVPAPGEERQDPNTEPAPEVPVPAENPGNSPANSNQNGILKFE